MADDMYFTKPIAQRISHLRFVWPGLPTGRGGYLGIVLAVATLGMTATPPAGVMAGGNAQHASAAGASILSGVLQDSLGNALAGARFNEVFSATADRAFVT
jgi:hypothetical protein